MVSGMPLNLNCTNCYFWVPVSGSLVRGECRYNVPEMIGMVDPKALELTKAVFPITSSGTWCGGFYDGKNDTLPKRI